MKSKFKIISYLSIPFLILLIVLIVVTIKDFETTFNSKNAGYFVVIILFFSVLLVFIEIKNKIIKIEILKNQIILNKYLGFGKSIYIDDIKITGFHKSIVHNEYFSYNYIYLMGNNKKIAKISNQYHKNFEEIQKTIQKQFKNLGYIHSGFRNEFKDIFDIE